MRILGIETSCDESAVAYLDIDKGKVRVLEHIVASQAVHEKYGGVVPEVAAREHSVTLPRILSALAEQVTGKTDGRELGKRTDLIAVAQGPGLVTSLRVGVETAKALAYAWGRPVYGINHIEAHVAANWLPGGGLEGNDTDDTSMFPALALVVSGGHTELLQMKKHGTYRLIGSTRDDAAGETFDKVAKLLGLGYPGGPEISKRAAKGNPLSHDFPRPMINEAHYDFSFSGLKTAVRYFLQKHRRRLEKEDFVNDVAASVEKAIVDVLVAKAVRAARDTKAKAVLLAGGVAANGLLRDTLRQALAEALPGVAFVQPEPKNCTDNAAMIAMAGYFAAARGKASDPRAMDVKIGWELGRK